MVHSATDTEREQATGSVPKDTGASPSHMLATRSSATMAACRRHDTGVIPSRALATGAGAEPHAAAVPHATAVPRAGQPFREGGLRRRDALRKLEHLGDEIAALAAHLHAATYELLRLLCEFDRREGWGTGFRSCAHWLSWRTGIAPGAAREKVRVARALAALPRLSSAMRRGELSYAKVRAVTRVATPDNEERLLELARNATAAQLERVVRAWRKVDRLEEQLAENERHRRRQLTLYVDDDGSYVLRARLDPEAGAALERALAAAAEALFGRTPAGAREPGGPEPATPLQRRADAIGLVAECALAGGLLGAARPGCAARAGEAEPTQTSPDQTTAAATPMQAATHGHPAAPDHVDAIAGPGPPAPNRMRTAAGSHPAPPASEPDTPDRTDSALDRTRRRGTITTRADRFQVVVHVDAAALRAGSEAGQSVLAPGIRVSAETSRRLACDASRVLMLHGEDGTVLGASRRGRTVPPAIRRALEHRDRGCRFPGCDARFCDAHHLVHWADGGATRLDNLLLLCRAHHRAVHEEGWRVTLSADGDVRFQRPDGRELPQVPMPPAVPAEPVVALKERHGAQALAIDGWTAAPQDPWRPLDLHWAVLVLRGSRAPEGPAS